jgi:hypothetical protein
MLRNKSSHNNFLEITKIINEIYNFSSIIKFYHFSLNKMELMFFIIKLNK